MQAGLDSHQVRAYHPQSLNLACVVLVGAAIAPAKIRPAALAAPTRRIAHRPRSLGTAEGVNIRLCFHFVSFIGRMG